MRQIGFKVIKYRETLEGGEDKQIFEMRPLLKIPWEKNYVLTNVHFPKRLLFFEGKEEWEIIAVYISLVVTNY